MSEKVLSIFSNGEEKFAMGVTGPYSYIKDSNLSAPLLFSETGQAGLTGIDSRKSLIGYINKITENSSLYSNATAMPEKIGGYDAGTTFGEKTVKEMFDGLLYPYQDPSFSSFSFSGWSATLEVGASTPTDPTATWTVTNSSNILANSLKIEDVTGSNVLITGADTTSPQALTASAVTNTSQASNIWRITAMNTDTPAVEFTRNYTVNWYWKIYAGTSVSTTLNEAAIEGLTDFTSLASNFARTYNLSAGGYKYICYPAVMGVASAFKDSSGLDVAMTRQTPDVSVTNSEGVSTDYIVYRTSFTQVSAIDITIL